MGALTTGSVNVNTGVVSDTCSLCLAKLNTSNRLLPLFNITMMVVTFFTVICTILSRDFVGLTATGGNTGGTICGRGALGMDSTSGTLLHGREVVFANGTACVLGDKLDTLVVMNKAVCTIFRLGALGRFPDALVRVVSMCLPLIVTFIVSVKPVSTTSVSVRTGGL